MKDSSSDDEMLTIEAAATTKVMEGKTSSAKPPVADADVCILSSSDEDGDDTSLTRRHMQKQPIQKTTTRKSPSASSSTAMEKHDPSVRADSLRAMEQAKAARENLRRAQRYHAEDVEVELPPVPSPSPQARRLSVSNTLGSFVERSAVVDLDSNVITLNGARGPISSQAASRSVQSVTYSGPTICLSLRYRGCHSTKEVNTALKIKMDEPLQYLADRFHSHHRSWILGSWSVAFRFDGRNLDLARTPSSYEMEDEDLVDVVIYENGGGVSSIRMNGENARTANGYGDPSAAETVMIHVRRKGESSHHTFRVRKMDPLSKLVAAYCKQYQLSSVTFEYNGRQLDPSKSPHSEGVLSNVFLDAVVSGASDNKRSMPSEAGTSTGGGGGKYLKLKVRVDDKSKDVQTIIVPFKGHFKPAMDLFAQKRNVSIEHCKFIFDGEELQPMSTPEHLDLEGDEIIDVKLLENPLPSALKKDNVCDVVMIDVDSTNTSRPAVSRKICIKTNRNVRL